MAEKKRPNGRVKDGPPGLEYINGWYHYRRTFEGKTHQKALKTKSFAKAVRMVEELNESIEDKKIQPALALNRAQIDFEKAATDYLAIRPLRPRSRKKYELLVRNITTGMTALLGRPLLLITDFTKPLVQDYVKKRQTDPCSPNGHPNTPKQEGVSPKTIDGELALLKSILRNAVTRGWLVSVPPLDGLSPKKPKKLVDMSSVARPLEEDELPQIFQAAKKYDCQQKGFFVYDNYFFAILATYIYAGLRHEECQYLEWTDIDFKADLLKIRSKMVECRRRLMLSDVAYRVVKKYLRPEGVAFPNNPQILDEIGPKLKMRSHKWLLAIQSQDVHLDSNCIFLNEKFRWQPKASEGEVVLHPDLKSVLLALEPQKTGNFIFPDPDGGFWRMHFERHLHNIVRLAGITAHIRVHDLRHTTGAMLRRRGVALETIKEILRHANIEETLIYAQYEHAEGRQAISKLPALIV